MCRQELVFESLDEAASGRVNGHIKLFLYKSDKFFVHALPVVVQECWTLSATLSLESEREIQVVDRRVACENSVQIFQISDGAEHVPERII